MYLIFVLFIAAINFSFKNTNKLFSKRNLPGYDNRVILKNETDISIIKEYFFKYDLLSYLQSDTIGINEKLRLIQGSPFLDDLRLNIIQAPNLSKGLKW